jgi:hypothetical protein
VNSALAIIDYIAYIIGTGHSVRALPDIGHNHFLTGDIMKQNTAVETAVVETVDNGEALQAMTETLPDTGIVRIKADALIIEQAEVTTRLFVNDYFVAHPSGNILKHIISEACASSLWLAARRGNKAAKDATFPMFAGPGIAGRGLTNTLRDSALLASRATSAELAEKYSEVLRIARFAMSCSKMVSADKKVVDTIDDVFAAEEKAAEERKAKRAANDAAEKEALIAIENLAATKAKLVKFLNFTNEITEVNCKLTKSQIIETLLDLATAEQTI